MHAFILAGGRGVRLRPYTTRLPKPLVPIGDRFSILEIVLQQLADQGFTRVTLSIGYLGHLINSFVGDGSEWGLEIDYVSESTPLGTMGPVRLGLDRLPDHFLVMNGDVLTDINYADLLTTHAASGASMSIATYRRTVDIDFGVLKLRDGAVYEFEEKPTIGYQVSMGVYGLSKATLAPYEVGTPFGFDNLVLDLLRRGQHPRAYEFDGFWLDVGRPDDYDNANEIFDDLSALLLPGRDLGSPIVN